MEITTLGSMLLARAEALGDGFLTEVNPDSVKPHQVGDIHLRIERNQRAGLAAGDIIAVPYDWADFHEEVIAAWALGIKVVPASCKMSGIPVHRLRGDELTRPAPSASGALSDQLGSFCIGVSTSGTTAASRTVAHSPQALLASTVMTARHQTRSVDCDIPLVAEDLRREVSHLLLPSETLTFTTSMPARSIGGLTILTRALLLGQRLITLKGGHASLEAALLFRPGLHMLGLDPVTARTVARRGLSAKHAPGTVGAVVMGGGQISSSLMQAVETALGAPALTGYGMTEMCGPISISRLDDSESDRWFTVGTPLPGVTTRIIDVTGRDCGQEEVGMLHVRAPTRMLGYLQEESRPMREDFSDADGWFPTGNLFSQSSGSLTLTFVSRQSDEILRGGLRVDAFDLEETLRRHPLVSEAAVVSGSSAITGEVEVVAIVESADDLNAWALRDWLVQERRRQKSASMVPQHFVVARTLPRTSDGSVSRREAREHWLARDTTGASRGSGRSDGLHGGEDWRT